MSAIVAKVRREPALLVALVTAILIALTEFGFELTSGQQAAIIGVVIAIGAIIVRQSVTPNVSVGALDHDADYPARHSETGAYDTSSLLVALACLVLIVCGLVWLVRQF